MEVAPWSATRARTFQECRRKYWYRYHLAPAARRPSPPPLAAEVARAKDLIGLEAWAGSVVHELIERCLARWRKGYACSGEELEREANRLLSNQFRTSQEYWNASPESFPRRPTLLDLHYYREGPLAKDRAAQVKDRVLKSVRGFLDSPLAREIRRVGPSNWLPIDRNAAAHLDSDLVIYVKPDFAYRADELLYILDWKTGRDNPYWEQVQVTCYALYAAEKWGHPLPQIVPEIVHLYPEFRMSDTEFTPESVWEVKAIVRESQGEILAVLEPDGSLPPEERFPCAEDSTRCRWCPFRGFCEGASRST